MVPAAFLSLVAQTLPDPNSSASIGWLLAALAGLALTVNQILGTLLNIRRLRGNDPAADERYATKDEHNALSDRVTLMQGEIRAQGSTLATELRAIHRSLGRIEGAMKIEPARQADAGG